MEKLITESKVKVVRDQLKAQRNQDLYTSHESKVKASSISKNRQYQLLAHGFDPHSHLIFSVFTFQLELYVSEKMEENAGGIGTDLIDTTRLSCFFCDFKSSKVKNWVKHLKRKHCEKTQSLINLEIFINGDISDNSRKLSSEENTVVLTPGDSNHSPKKRRRNDIQCLQKVKNHEKQIHVDVQSGLSTSGLNAMAYSQSAWTQPSRKNVGCINKEQQMKKSLVQSPIKFKRNVAHQKPDDQAVNENNTTESNLQGQEIDIHLLQNTEQNASNQPVAPENMGISSLARENTELGIRLAKNSLETLKREHFIWDSNEIEAYNSAMLDFNPVASCYSCPHCKFIFRAKAYLKRHLISCNYSSLPQVKVENIDVVPNVGEVNKSTAMIEGHVYFKCSKCDKLFVKQEEQIRHLALHCTLCSYIGEGPEMVVRHRRTHTNERPFKCDYCEFRATVKAAVVAHARIHTGERPFQCKLCDYTGKTATHLRLHEAKHSVSKAYSCQICGKQFTQKSSLNRHVKREVCTDLNLFSV